MRVRQLVRLGALCAAALMLCSCDFLGFDGDIEPDGWEGTIVKVDQNNRVLVLFDDTDEWDFPYEFETPAQWIQLVGVAGLEPPNADGEGGDDYGEEAKTAVASRFGGRTVYVELPEGKLISAGAVGNGTAYLALVYPDYDSYADKVSLNEIILRSGWGLYDELYVPDSLQWDFEQAAEEAEYNHNGIYDKNTWQP